jgi:hypothetical protein
VHCTWYRQCTVRGIGRALNLSTTIEEKISNFYTLCIHTNIHKYTHTHQEGLVRRILHGIGSVLHRNTATAETKRQKDCQAQRKAAGILGTQLMGIGNANLTIDERKAVRRVAKGRVWTGMCMYICMGMCGLGCVCVCVYLVYTYMICMYAYMYIHTCITQFDCR